METLPVHLYAAFAADESGGNMGGVVFEDTPLWPAARQRIAADLGAPTTGFVRQVGEDRFQTRFHSTRTEMDMCGHVTLAVFTALQQADRIQSGNFIQETTAGDIRVDVVPEGTVTMHQPLPTFDAGHFTQEQFAPLLGLDVDGLLGASSASTALRHVFVQVKDPEALAAIKPDEDGLRSLCAEKGIDTIGVWCRQSSVFGKMQVRLRDLCHGVGDPEEAASGTTNGALACDLFRSKNLRPGMGGQAVLVTEQGFEMGRPSIVRSVLNTSGHDITGVSVGGFAALRMKGEFVV